MHKQALHKVIKVTLIELATYKAYFGIKVVCRYKSERWVLLNMG